MALIQHVHAREILDSRGRPTVEAEIHLAGGVVGRASVPSGASTGTFEACELRDASSPWYGGFGVRQAVENVRTVLGPELLGLDPADQQRIDARLIELDGTANKTRLGANALLAVSLSTARAAALERKVPLYRYLAELAGGQPRVPRPMTNMISGGAHANRNLDFQDVLVMPVGAPDFPTALEWIVRIYRALGKALSASGLEGYLVGDEGGFGPRLASNREALEVVVQAIQASGLEPGKEVTIALDVAASQFYQSSGKYALQRDGQELDAGGMIDLLDALAAEFPVTSIEDGLHDGDWEGWQRLTQRLGQRLMLVGDDLFVTSASRLKTGIDKGVANAILIKVNQIGTLSETLATMRLARQHGYKCIVSARSGETEDDFLADLAVGTAADSIKIGGVARSERLAKYNRLLRIAEEIA